MPDLSNLPDWERRARDIHVGRNDRLLSLLGDPEVADEALEAIVGALKEMYFCGMVHVAAVVDEVNDNFLDAARDSTGDVSDWNAQRAFGAEVAYDAVMARIESSGLATIP